jgi:hypothetical protein
MRGKSQEAVLRERTSRFTGWQNGAIGCFWRLIAREGARACRARRRDRPPEGELSRMISPSTGRRAQPAGLQTH